MTKRKNDLGSPWLMKRSQSEPFSPLHSLSSAQSSTIQAPNSPSPYFSPSQSDTVTPSTPTPPLRPSTLDVRPQYYANDKKKERRSTCDKELQTPDDIRFEDSTETFCYSALHLKDIDMRFMDESAAVMPSPDAADFGDDSSGISATDFHFPSSPIKARLDSLMYSPPPLDSFSATGEAINLSELPPASRHFLYGKPLPRYTTPPEGFNTTGCFIKRLLSPAKPLANISTSDSSEDHGHHVHYSHHEHFQQDAGLPHYKDLLRSLDVGSGINLGIKSASLALYCDSPNSCSARSPDDLTSTSTSECGECCGGHAPYPQQPADPNASVLIPTTMSKGTQISPTTIAEMYAAAVLSNSTSRTTSARSSVQRSRNGATPPQSVERVPKPMKLISSNLNGFKRPETKSSRPGILESRFSQSLSFVNERLSIELKNYDSSANEDKISTTVFCSQCDLCKQLWIDLQRELCKGLTLFEYAFK